MTKEQKVEQLQARKKRILSRGYYNMRIANKIDRKIRRIQNG
jgi:hypothetical protein